MIANYYDYFVSSDGHIYNINTGMEEPIWMDSKAGYSHVSLNIEGKRRIRKVHRLVALIYIPNPDEENLDEVNHKDGNKQNNDYTNLEWSNSFLNNKHARDTGLNNISESNRNRWKNKDFSKFVRENMSKAAIERNMVGDRNPNFKMYLLYKNTKYTLKEFQSIINLSYSGLYARVRKSLDNNLDYFYFNNTKVYILKG